MKKSVLLTISGHDTIYAVIEMEEEDVSLPHYVLNAEGLSLSYPVSQRYEIDKTYPMLTAPNLLHLQFLLFFAERSGWNMRVETWDGVDLPAGRIQRASVYALVINRIKDHISKSHPPIPPISSTSDPMPPVPKQIGDKVMKEFVDASPENSAIWAGDW